MTPFRFCSVLTVPLIVLFAFAIPVVQFVRSANGEFLSLFFAPTTLRVATQTLILGISALAVTWALALPAAFSLFRFRNPFSTFLQKCLEFFWVFPSFVYVFIVIFFLKAFQVEGLYSLRSVWISWIFAGFPFLTVSLLSALKDLDPREREAFRTLGASRFKEIGWFDLAKLKSSLQSLSFHQLWLYFTSFTLVVLLNGGPPNETLEVAIYTSVRMDRVRYEQALAFTLWQVLFLMLLRLALSWSGTKNALTSEVGVEWFRRSVGRSKMAIFFQLLAAISVVVLLFFKNEEGLLGAVLTGVLLSLVVAGSTLAYFFFLFYLRVTWLLEWGAWFSPMVLSLTWWKMYGFSAPAFALCLGVQILLFAPLVSRVLQPLLQRERRFEVEAMRTLGATALQAWLGIEWPRIRRPVLWIGSIIFSLSLCEVNAVLLFSRGDFEPLAVWVQNQWMRFQLDSAFYGTILIVSFSVFAISWVNHEQEA